MKNLFKILMILLLGFACSSDDDGDVITQEGPFKIYELQGTWDATQALFSGDDASVDIIQEGGSVSITIERCGGFSMTINPAGRDPYIVRGLMFWEEWEGQFYFAIEWADSRGDWDTYGADLTNNNKTFSINGGLESGEYDFDDDGDMEPASVSFTFNHVDSPGPNKPCI